jgi:organic radical activating enzyme
LNESRRLLKAGISEIFSSIQGEGLFAGQMHRFVRFSGCNLACTYCDTPASRDRNGGRVYTVDSLIKELAGNDDCPGRMLCLTGGEPLLQADFIRDLLMTNRRENAFCLPILLETNGTLPGELEKVIPYVDFISMDIKLPKDAGKDGTSLDKNLEFLKISYIKRVYVKVVIREDSDRNEFRKTAELVESVDPGIPFYIQPVTPYGRITASPSSDTILDLYHLACARLKDVYVMPQIHKVLGLK